MRLRFVAPVFLFAFTVQLAGFFPAAHTEDGALTAAGEVSSSATAAPAPETQEQVAQGPDCGAAAAPLLKENATTKDYMTLAMTGSQGGLREVFSSPRDNSSLEIESRVCSGKPSLTLKIDFTPWPRNPEPNNMLTSASATLSRLQMAPGGPLPADLMKTLAARLQDMQRSNQTSLDFCPGKKGGGACAAPASITVTHRLITIRYGAEL